MPHLLNFKRTHIKMFKHQPPYVSLEALESYTKDEVYDPAAHENFACRYSIIHIPTPGTREHFLQVSQLQRWGTIQEYVDLCRTHGYFTPAFYAKAVAHMERIHVRRRLRQATDGRGWPTVANIVRAGDDGRPARMFMQEELFGPEEYRQVVAYHYGLARHHLFKAQTYREHAKARFGLQLPLFDEDEGGAL